jgi:Cft2 family RNA processing exonuclease
MTAVIESPVSPDLLDIAGRVLTVCGVDPDDDARAMQDIDAVREALALVVSDPEVRAAVGATMAADGVTPAGDAAVLLGVDRAAAMGLLERVRAAIRAHRDEIRRAQRAAKRGTPEERRISRLSEEVAQAKRGKSSAETRAATLEAEAATLRRQAKELSEALADAEERAADQEAATSASRAALTNPRILARALRGAMQSDPSLLATAGVAVPDVDVAQLVPLVDALLGELADPQVGRQLAVARALSVRMLGGGVEVGGSCALVTAGDTGVLVDVGTRPGQVDVDKLPPPGLEAALAEGPVQAIVLTHAHADHVGWVPAVTAAHPDVPVYATAPTADLLATMWRDSARIFSRRDGAVPYTGQDVHGALRLVQQVEYGQPVQVGDLTIELFPAGHVLGAAGVLLSDGSSSAVVSGDVSGPGQRSVGGWDIPEHALGPDLLVLESTYGAAPVKLARSTVEDSFLRDVERTVASGGRVLVPAFALGRAQEIALLLAAHLPHVPVLIDGLARDVTGVFEKYTGPGGSTLEIWSDQVTAVPRGHTSAAVARFRSGVVITTSGMLAAGPAQTWAAAVLPDPRSLLAVVGYQDPNSPGGRLLDLDETGGQWYLPGVDGQEQTVVEVVARVRKYGLGAHASADELVTIATQVRAKTTKLVHGDPQARQMLAARLKARHLNLVAADETWRPDSVSLTS